MKIADRGKKNCNRTNLLKSDPNKSNVEKIHDVNCLVISKFEKTFSHTNY